MNVLTSGASPSSRRKQLWPQADAEDTQAFRITRGAPSSSTSPILSPQQRPTTGADQGSLQRSGRSDDCLQPLGTGHVVW